MGCTHWNSHSSVQSVLLSSALQSLPWKCAGGDKGAAKYAGGGAQGDVAGRHKEESNCCFQTQSFFVQVQVDKEGFLWM